MGRHGVPDGWSGGRVIEVLARLVSLHGAPRYLRSDNGPEFVAAAILQWLGPQPGLRGCTTVPLRNALAPNVFATSYAVRNGIAESK